MLTNSILPMPLKSRAAAAAMEGRDASWRRVSHGSTRFATDPRMRQPQDGALDLPTRVASISSKLQPALPMEPEDARLTGLTRSLYRRVMGLNVMNVTEATAMPLAAVKPLRKPQGRPALSPFNTEAQVA